MGAITGKTWKDAPDTSTPIMAADLEAIEAAVEDANAAVTPTPLTTSSDINALPAGSYVAYPSSVASALGLPNAASGVLTVGLVPGGGGVQTYTAVAGTSPAYIRSRSAVVNPWSEWTPLTYTRAAFTANVDTLTAPGVYPFANSLVSNTPDDIKIGTLIVYRTTPSASAGWAIQMCINGTAGSATPDVWLRRESVGTWTPWKQLAWADTVDSIDQRVTILEQTSGGGSPLVRSGEHDIRVEGIRSRIGQVKANGKAVVAFVCDHGSAAFETIILPKLQAHNMKATLAMCSDQLTLEPGEVASWSTVAGWAASDDIEIACHSKDHQDVSGTAALVEQIMLSRDALSSNLGGLPVDSWVQPGARNVITPGETWDGFMDGQGSHRYLTTAGELIWNSYGMATGQVTRPGTQAAARVFPLTGAPPLGPARRFIDGGAPDIAIAQATVDHAITVGGRCIVSLHPNYIGKAGYLTQSEAESFIDWLAAKATAGDIMLVQLREWAIAEA